MRQQRVGQRDDPQHHGLEEGVELVDRHFLRKAGRRTTGIVDENIDAAELVLDGLNHGFDEIVIGKITPHPVGLALAERIDRLAIFRQLFTASAN